MSEDEGGFLEVPCFYCENAIYANKEEYYTHYTDLVSDRLIWMYLGMPRCGANHVSAAFKAILQEANGIHRISCRREKKFTRIEIVHLQIHQPPPPPQDEMEMEIEYEEEERAITESFEEAGPAMKPASAESVNYLLAKKNDEREGHESTWKVSECVICMDEIDTWRGSLAMDCGHVFHNKCLSQWLNTSHVCPLYRYKMPTDDNHHP